MFWDMSIWVWYLMHTTLNEWVKHFSIVTSFFVIFLIICIHTAETTEIVDFAQFGWAFAIILDRKYQKFLNWFVFLNYPALDYKSVIKDWCKQKSKESKIRSSFFQPRILALISKKIKIKSLFTIQRRPQFFQASASAL